MYLFTSFQLICVYTQNVSMLHVKLLFATALVLSFSPVPSHASAAVVGLHVSHAVC